MYSKRWSIVLFIYYYYYFFVELLLLIFKNQSSSNFNWAKSQTSTMKFKMGIGSSAPAKSPLKSLCYALFMWYVLYGFIRSARVERFAPGVCKFFPQRGFEQCLKKCQLIQRRQS